MDTLPDLVDASGRQRLEHVDRGDRVQGALEYVGFPERDLLRDLRHELEGALEESRLTVEESALLVVRFEAGLAGYTYLWSEGHSEARPSHTVAETATKEPTVQ